MDQSPPPQTNKTELSFITKVIATGLFSGYIPWASGTFGSLVGLLVYEIPGMESPVVLPAFIIAGFFVGVVTSNRVAQAVGHQLTASAQLMKETFQPDEHTTADPSIVVIDEIVGMWISLFLLPKTVLISVMAFVIFRFYDIVKPPPARQLERFRHGWGIMLDDVAAGIYANVTVRLCLFLFPGLT